MKLPMITTAALLLGSAAYGQDICGGAGTGGQWIGGTETASDIATADTHREQLALVLGETPFVGLFTLSDSTSVRVEAAGRGAGDPLIEIFDSTGAIIASDDDSGGGGAARAELDLGQGTYCVSMKSYENSPMSAFMRVGRTDHEALTPGEADSDAATNAASGSCADARPFGAINATQSAAVDETGFWSFTLDTPTPLTITANNDDADPTIALFDASEVEIASNDDHNGLNSKIEQAEPLPAGDYCLSVGAINNTAIPIDVTINVYDAEAALAELFDLGEAAPPLDGSIPFTELGKLDTRMRHDVRVDNIASWFTIEIPETGMMLVEAIAAGDDGDPWLVIYDDLGRRLGLNDDAGDSLNSLLTARVQPGTYVIGLKQVGEDAQGFVRLLLERYVPAR